MATSTGHNSRGDKRTEQEEAVKAHLAAAHAKTLRKTIDAFHHLSDDLAASRPGSRKLKSRH
jgi:hypothetical protein